MKQRFQITEHALLRYLERVKGIDMAVAREEITQILAAGDGFDGFTAVTSNGYRYVLAGQKLVTVKPAASVFRQTYGHT